jgi:hypothetical protein
LLLYTLPVLVKRVAHHTIYHAVHHHTQYRELLIAYYITLYTPSNTVKRVTKRREQSFGGDEVQQTENMLQKEAFRTLKLAKAKVRETVCVWGMVCGMGWDVLSHFSKCDV